jgi:alpha-beta hydrolase superfamily lysophospholipase
LPVLLLGGKNDRIVCTKAIREVADKTGENVIYHEEPLGRHVLRDEAEPIRTSVLNKIEAFLQTKNIST